MKGNFWKTFWREARSQPSGVYFLALLTLVGLVTGILRLIAGLGNTTNLNDGYPWGLWIGFDLFIVAFSGGAFTLATLVYIFRLERLHAALRPTILTGLLGYLSVLIILAMDLGRWDRFYHFLIYPNINSPLFEVSWCIFLYTLVLIVEFSPVYLQKAGKYNLLKFIKRITIPLVIVGITLSTLHQSSLGTLFIIMTNRLHPLWYSPLISLFFFVSSLIAGLAMVIGGATVSYWVFHRTLPEKALDDLGWFIPWVTGFYLIIKFGELLVFDKLHLL
ncbi:MAG: NrfD/PsrC family molybdoenzyme membrane anchor subunit, partial [Anaerolineales bacterium]